MKVKFWATARLEDGKCTVTVHGAANYHKDRDAFRRIEIPAEKAKAVGAELEKVLAAYVGTPEKEGPMVMEIQAAGYEAYKYERDHQEIIVT